MPTTLSCNSQQWQTLLQKIGEHIERTMQDEMEKMSTMIKGSLADQTRP